MTVRCIVNKEQRPPELNRDIKVNFHLCLCYGILRLMVSIVFVPKHLTVAQTCNKTKHKIKSKPLKPLQPTNIKHVNTSLAIILPKFKFFFLKNDTIYRINFGSPEILEPK